ncbi:MAG TPA: tRNA pseudouridine(55) synthase TruB [Candidatus Binataceae bacterium]|nr:tRNA pseudouridine(55) synthase TruB [Candidatus Binataceae bacterium]
MNGVIIIDKPAGVTSAEVVRRVKRLVKPARVGHLGTLDPFATGVLPILIGEATKLAPFMEGGEKRYEGTIRLGSETDTLDRDGSVVRTAPLPSLTTDRLAALEREFTGRISQTPPVFSAIKRAGVPLYRLARKGIDVEPPQPREIEISSLRLELASLDALRFTLACSAGTYVRALARDIGNALGSAAHLEQLRRTRSGGFSIEDALPLDRLLAAMETKEPAGFRLIALAEVVPALPGIQVDPELERRLRHGDSSALDLLAPAAAELFKVVNNRGQLVAVARATSRATSIIERVFNE